MCFSATASFASAAVLIPAGIYCLKQSCPDDKASWSFAIIPAMFGMQQLFEGGVWLGLESGQGSLTRLSSLGFIFFSHLFWLVWIPLSSYWAESELVRKRLFLGIVAAGVFLGVTFFPFFIINPDWLQVSIVNHSIEYKTRLIYAGILSREVITGLYILVVMVPLLASTDTYHKRFGVLVLISMVITLAFFYSTFTSVWCYFAGILSLYIYYKVVHTSRTSVGYF
jgi:hypothetical protein